MIPARSSVTKGATLQLQVKAHYSDGSVEDVTKWAKFASADETVAKVDPANGQVEIIGHGKAP
ncbi:MAG: Ig-like domain-containing protein [Verrucomicrobiales bacterium]